MLYKYDQTALNKELSFLNITGYTKIQKMDPKKETLEIILYSDELKYQILFYIDICSKNNNFFKKQSKIITSGEVNKKKLETSISSFFESYIPEQHEKLSDFFLFLKDYLDIINNKLSKNNTKISFIEKLDTSTNNQLIINTILIHIFVILLKIFVGFFGYSGENDPPKFGDFEAQRHWMEITINIDAKNWYTDSVNNSKEYWPLDYPPLSGYHSFILGHILKKIIPDSVELKKSYGYENLKLKIIMRFFVLISDLLTFHIGVNLFCWFIFIYKQKLKLKKIKYFQYYCALLLILINPLLIIIDHGHFQYNNVMYGFFVIALFCLYSENYLLAIIFYSFCVNYKQMGLYYAIPFPLYVIKKLLFEKNNNKLLSIVYILIYGITTIITNVIIYIPWIKNKNINDIFIRIFPVQRGIFEDKVATFWCTLNIVIKLKKVFTREKLIKFCFILTLMGCVIPVLSILFAKKLTNKIATQCFFVISLTFFLFSFHVHEKTIIIPFLAYLLNLFHMKNLLPSFSLVGMFSLYPLLKRERQVIPYFITTVLFYVLCKFVLRSIDYNIRKENELLNKAKKHDEEKEKLKSKIWFLFELAIFSITIFYHFLEYLVPPPKRYPWFYPMLNAAFCFCYFGSVYLYSNILLIQNILNDYNEKKLKQE